MSSKYYFILVRCGTLFATLVSLLCGLGMIGSSPAEAATTSCSISSTGIAFSDYNTSTKAAVDGVGTITLTCTGTQTDTLTIFVNGGNNYSCTNRQMRSGSSSLVYNTFRDAARTQTWCEGSDTYSMAINYSSSATQTINLTIYGRIAAGQNAPLGSYSDMLSVSVKNDSKGQLSQTNLAVSSRVSPSCTVSAGTLGFGTYNQSAATLGTGTVQVNCPTGASYEIALGTGSNFSASRRMAGPSANFLDYRLYADSARSLLWGDGATLGPRVSGTGNGTTQTLSVYGSIPGGQNKVIGNYSDTVVVTLSY